MKVSLSWIRFLNEKYRCAADPAPDGIGQLVDKIGSQLGAVEEVIDLGEHYKGIVVVKVISATNHSQADKLKICWIDDGGAIKKVARNDKGFIQVICGAPNVAAGQLVAWLPPGSSVPATIDKEPFVLEAREIRGQLSSGMIASAKELALGDDHEGILVIDEPAKPGDDFAKIYKLDDYIIDIENKMFTHRPDLFGQLGIARELAGIQGHSFKSPLWYRENASIKIDGRNSGLKLEIKNAVPKLVPRFCALALLDVKVGPSPIWLQSQLSRLGVRPVNNIVDVTNLLMLETAQPLHAYDYDKVKSGVLGIRLSKKGERLELLGGKQINLAEGAIVITDGSKPIGLGGIMGGTGTQVDENTRNIILESANFDMNLTRRTAMAYGLFTDAATRFTKNQSPRQNLAVITKAIDDILRMAGGRIASPLIDDKHLNDKPVTVKASAEFINNRLGLDLSVSEIQKLLQNVEFSVTLSGDLLEVEVPFWRTDIAIPEDIVEEVGRLYGYDKLPLVLPERKIEPVSQDRLLAFKDSLRQRLSAFGANEALTYSFVDGRLLKKTGQDDKNAYKLSNALSPGLQYYRLNLMPSLLDKVHPNIKAGFDEFALFEIGKGHDKHHKDDDGLPQELELLGLIFAAGSKTGPKGSAYYQTKHYLDRLGKNYGLEFNYKPIAKLPSAGLAQPYKKGRSALVSVKSSGKDLGIIGEFKTDVRQQLKLPKYAAGFEIDITALMDSAKDTKDYRPPPRFPQIHQDICLRTMASSSYAALSDFLITQLNESKAKQGYEYDLAPIDIFQKDGDIKHKQTTWRLTLSHPERTMTIKETNKLLDKIAKNAKKQLNAERI